jgi:hypothetical protein
MAMPSLRALEVLDQVSDMPLSGHPSLAGEKLRSEALALVQEDRLVEAAYSYRIVELDHPAGTGDELLYVGGTTLPAPKLIPESGRLTALAFAVTTVGSKIEQRISGLFGEKRPSLALALDELGNQLLFAATRYAVDRIHADVMRRSLTMAGELHAGDPGLDLDSQGTVLRLAQAEDIGVGLLGDHVMTPLKSGSMVFGVGIDLPAATWSRCDECSSRARGKCLFASGANAVAAGRRR